MKTIFGIALIGSLSLLLTACSNLPLRQASAESVAPSPTLAATHPTIVLPAVLTPFPQPAYPRLHYPSDIRYDQRPALVEVDCVIDESGRVLTAQIQKCTNPEFGKAVLHAIREWTFRPGTRDGRPAAMHVVVPVEYVIKG